MLPSLPALAVVLLTACTQQASQQPTSTGPSKPASMQERWWNWAIAEPNASNPVADTSGAFCDRNQPDDVWFFAGTFGDEVKRHCTVPAGRTIVAPLLNLIGEGPSDCAEFMRGATGRAELDGKALASERLEGEPVTVRGVADNPVTQTDQALTGTACGLWVRIPALEPGTHELVIQGKAGSFSTYASYTLEVTGKE